MTCSADGNSVAQRKRHSAPDRCLCNATRNPECLGSRGKVGVGVELGSAEVLLVMSREVKYLSQGHTAS